MHATSKGVGVALWAATAVAAFGIGWIASPPQEPPVPDDLAASLRSALGEGGVSERQLRTASLLAGLDPDAVLEVAALYERMIPLIDSSELAAFFAAWARFDPVGAIDHALSWPLPEMREQRQVGEVAIEVNDLQGAKVPRSASFELRYGEVLGIAGLVGSGRTEMIRAIFGLDTVRSGTVRVADLTGNSSAAERWRQGIGFLSEDRKQEGLALSMSIADNTTLSKLSGYGPMGSVLPGRQQEATDKWIDKLEIKCTSAKQTVGALSGGNQQKVALARLLEHDVDVLILDEPTRGIDVGSKALFYRIIDELVRGDPANGIAPKAVLMVSSYLPELLGVCDRVAVMCKGVLKPARETAQLDEHRIMLEAVGVE